MEDLLVMFLCSSHSIHQAKGEHMCFSNIYRPSKVLGMFNKGKEVSESFSLVFF